MPKSLKKCELKRWLHYRGHHAGKNFKFALSGVDELVKLATLQNKALPVAVLAAAARQQSSASGVLENFADTLVGLG